MRVPVPAGQRGHDEDREGPALRRAGSLALWASGLQSVGRCQTRDGVGRRSVVGVNIVPIVRESQRSGFLIYLNSMTHTFAETHPVRNAPIGRTVKQCFIHLITSLLQFIPLCQEITRLVVLTYLTAFLNTKPWRRTSNWKQFFQGKTKCLPRNWTA